MCRRLKQSESYLKHSGERTQDDIRYDQSDLSHHTENFQLKRFDHITWKRKHVLPTRRRQKVPYGKQSYVGGDHGVRNAMCSNIAFPCCYAHNVVIF